MRNWLWVLAVGAVCVAGSAGVVRGDGGYFKSRDRSTWLPVEGHEQRAVILCEGGRQRMWVALSVPSGEGKKGAAAEERGVWVLPVKGKLEEVKVDLVEEFPRLGGRSVRSRLNDQMDQAVLVMGATQVWPVLCVVPVILPSLSRDRSDVFLEVSKFGLTTQVVSAETLEGLTKHIEGEMGTVPDLSSFAPYFGGQGGGSYTFVVTMVRDVEEARRAVEVHQQLGVVAEFPSAVPWYPMLGTRVYGEEKVPVVVQVMGEWRFSGGRYAGAQVQLFERGEVWEKGWEKELGDGEFYTRVLLTEMPAKLFDEDMVFDAGAVWIDARAKFLTRGWGVWVFWGGVVVVHLGLSAAAGAMAAGAMRMSVREGARVGLYNIGTVFLVHWASKRNERADRQWRAKGFSRGFMFGYVLFWMVGVLLV